MIFNYYNIINQKNKKRYIGITSKDVELRFLEHKKKLRKGNHVNKYLQTDWNKYGEENFQFQLLEVLDCSSVEEGYDHEFYLIEREKKENLYNIAPGGLVNPMYSPEIRNKMIATKQSQVENIIQLEEIEENVFKVVNKFNSQKEAQKLTGLSQANISKSILQNVKGSGYYWINESRLKDFLQTWRPVRTKITPTAELDSQGNIVKVHHNRSLFEKEYGWTTGVIKGAVYRGGYTHGIKFINISEEKYYSIKPIQLLF